MIENIERVASSTQEQAIASWTDYLNQCRWNELVERLSLQDANLENALKELAELKSFIGDPSHILGSSLTKHGEIAEHMQVNISNARNAIVGLERTYTFEGVGRTAPEDYLNNGLQIQSKFYNGLRKTLFGSHGLSDHLKTYPDFVSNGGSYDIPKDQFDEMKRILDLYKNNRSQLSSTEFTLAKEIDAFLESSGLRIDEDINPAVVDYKQVQILAADDTVKAEEKSIRKTDKERRLMAQEDTRATVQEGLKATGLSAAIEGGMAFCLSFAEKRKKKPIVEFTSEDWESIGIDTSAGAVKGGIRGCTIYVLTNFTQTPANVASGYVTAAFGVASQIRSLEKGDITDEEFVINCETVCLDAAISTVASFLGQTLIPVPVLGAVIGNVAGELIYELCKKQGDRAAETIIASYNAEMHELEKVLSLQLMQVLLKIKADLRRFMSIQELAFDEDVNTAFNGSIQLAHEVGVNENKILHNLNEIDDYFMGI